MFYNRFTFSLIIRILTINLLAIALYYLISKTELWFTITGLGIILITNILSLYFYINQIRKDIKRFVEAVKTQDNTLNFNRKATKGAFPELYKFFNELIKINKDMQLEKDSMFQLIKTILEQIPAGIIVIKGYPQDKEKTEIFFFNQAATNLLNIPAYKYWHRLTQHIPQFAKEIGHIGKGGKRFMELKIQDKLIQLSTEVIPLNLYQTDYTIISFQNIKDEIEQKEAEAWNRLIGVISHEILNSITPISSLSDTVNSMIVNKQSLNNEELEDLKPAIQTIKRRSEGLLDFVKDYRLIAELPTPHLEHHTIGEILQHIKVLMQPFAAGRNITLKVEQTSSRISIEIDLKLIEQALINLVTNSIYALENIPQPAIEIGYRLDQNKLYLEVTDNGKGIEPDLLGKIFVPFFTTRKSGSGIGLTITQNIMKMHQGSLEVDSTPFEKTTFSLIFKYL
ncbi:sensor histidine kinase [Pedobacter hiemivivus]|uniref:histidine kinase n=1 Tax=Pedobacter hiemivivus TaxID=2530454 RepID=A0A4R0MSG0_9SPHI|nr:HAMP domain-containing sensor histidine kinase [Pedobacter hiemivivus]TCC89918.1 HAMP domain-containing histidine kinase [Pedobacter hiemivivus]